MRWWWRSSRPTSRYGRCWAWRTEWISFGITRRPGSGEALRGGFEHWCCRLTLLQGIQSLIWRRQTTANFWRIRHWCIAKIRKCVTACFRTGDWNRTKGIIIGTTGGLWLPGRWRPKRIRWHCLLSSHRRRRPAKRIVLGGGRQGHRAGFGQALGRKWIKRIV